MPLTRFPDHEEKRVFLSTVLAFNLPAAPAAHTDRPSVAVIWTDEGTPAATELSPDFATSLLAHGASGIVCGGTASEAAAALFEEAIEDGDFVQSEAEEITIWSEPEATVPELLFLAAEEAMPADNVADDPWDIVVWVRSGDPRLGEIRQALGRLTDLVDEQYELGGTEEE